MIQDTIKLPLFGKDAELKLYFLEQIPGVQPRTRPVVIICPGGAYEHLSARESGPVALQFNARGFHACVLKYSVAPAVYPRSLEELTGAVCWAREQASSYSIDKDKIIICGFSAGGHLACCLGAFWQDAWLDEKTGSTAAARRPNGIILGYPVITSGQFAHKPSFDNLTGGDRALTERLSLENRVTDNMPPVFMWHTCGDTSVPVENSLLLAEALRRHRIPMELHVFPDGPHGLSLANEETASLGKEGQIQPQVQNWIDLASSWIKSL